MGPRLVAAVVLAGALGSAPVAFAQQELTLAQPPAPPAPMRWDHGGQFTVRASLSEGYRFVVRYRDGAGDDPCDAGNNKFCTGLSPLMLDTALGFGVTRGLELEGRFRLGLLTDAYTGSMQTGLGLRYMGDGSDRLKFVFAVAALVDFVGDRARAGGGVDVLVRSEQGLQYEVTRWFGVTFGAGETFGVLRNFSCIIDLNLGLQFRAPP